MHVWQYVWLWNWLISHRGKNRRENTYEMHFENWLVTLPRAFVLYLYLVWSQIVCISTRLIDFTYLKHPHHVWLVSPFRFLIASLWSLWCLLRRETDLQTNPAMKMQHQGTTTLASPPHTFTDFPASLQTSRNTGTALDIKPFCSMSLILPLLFSQANLWENTSVLELSRNALKPGFEFATASTMDGIQCWMVSMPLQPLRITTHQHTESLAHRFANWQVVKKHD